MMDIDFGTMMPCGGGCGTTFNHWRKLSVADTRLKAFDEGWGFVELWDGSGVTMACKKCKTREPSNSFIAAMKAEAGKS